MPQFTKIPPTLPIADRFLAFRAGLVVAKKVRNREQFYGYLQWWEAEF